VASDRGLIELGLKAKKSGTRIDWAVVVRALKVKGRHCCRPERLELVLSVISISPPSGYRS